MRRGNRRQNDFSIVVMSESEDESKKQDVSCSSIIYAK